MSGETASRLLQAHFARVGRSELVRLRKKLFSAGPTHRPEVERLSAEVVTAVAAQIGAALSRSGEARLVQAIVNLFGVTHQHDDLSAR